ncbi:MAG: transketolase [Bacteroidetes bacterium]|nr:transketolase [Bacteroidota bacterium]MCL5026883.1 transketolase [Chloroflexota bacterium]
MPPILNQDRPKESRAEMLARLESQASLIRQRIMTTLQAAGSGHVGGSMSCADIITALYFQVLRMDPSDPRWPDRDRFVLSKGHASAVLCPALAECGFFPRELLDTFNQLDSPFSMHPDMLKIPGADMSTGSLGHGLAIGLGMAMAARVQKRLFRAFVLMGDGELSEGSVWESAMAAAFFKVDNLIAIIDRNQFGSDCALSDLPSANALAEKWRAFGWSVREIDGHDMGQVVDALTEAPFETGRPSMIVANTVKGKGVPFAEARFDWHYHVVDQDVVDRSLAALRGAESAKEEQR